MNLIKRTKNPTQNVNSNKNAPQNQKQIKKRACTIKLEVSKLVRNQLNKIPSNQHNKSLFISSHFASQETYDCNKSVQKQPESKKRQKITKTFEELYFQKIKRLKLQQLNPQMSMIVAQKQRSNSCKNSVSIKNKSKTMTKQPLSTKNSPEVNKENVYIQDPSQNSSIFTENRFFMKQNKNDDAKVHSRKVDLNILGMKQNAIGQQKAKKLLRLKKVNVKSKYESLHQVKAQVKEFSAIQIHHNLQKRFLSPMNALPTSSQELRTFKLSTPLSSSSGSKLYPSSSSSSSVSLMFQQIIETRIDHSQHQHIWGSVECFFSFGQFEAILKMFGFDGESNEVGFYVRKLWSHLGGDLFGGVVKKNMVQFLSVALQDQFDQSQVNHYVATSKDQSPLHDDYIEKSSLRLINLSPGDKDQIRKFYFPLRMSKIASTITNPITQEEELKNPRNSPNTDAELEASTQRNIQINVLEARSPCERPTQTSQSFHLENIAYLDSVSVKNRQPQMSPYMIEKSPDATSHQSIVTDFSPKMTPQTCEPFKSTILQKQSPLQQKLCTQLQPQTYNQSAKPYRKPLLSVDVNIGEGVMQKLVVYEGQDPYEVSLELKNRYDIGEDMRERFQIMLKNHLKNLLFKIQEVSEELFEDSVELKDQCYEQDQQYLEQDFILMERQS